jgi:thiamine biosynthesis lipoprotein
LTLCLWLIPLACDAPAGDEGKDAPAQDPPKLTFTVMGTEANLLAVGEPARARQALLEGRQALEKLDALASTYKESSQISRLNRAKAGQSVELAPELVAILELARDVGRASDGAFDVTVRPVLGLWRRAGKQGKMPSRDELADVRRLVGPDVLAWNDRSAAKSDDAVEVDLGGIAKGAGIDWATEAIGAQGIDAGFVDVGGDIRCWGQRPDGKAWRVGLRDPFSKGPSGLLGVLEIRDAAVCTSGNYFRYFQVGKRRLSHIVDPRTAKPVDAAPSVTVIAPTAATADAWATALSVLGPAGLTRIAKLPGVEALVITGSAENYRAFATEGFLVPLVEGTLARKIRENLPNP